MCVGGFVTQNLRLSRFLQTVTVKAFLQNVV